MITSAVILAAGLSSRMGDFKPLMKLKDKTVIENLIDTLLSSSIKEIIIVVGHKGRDIEDHLIANKYKDKIKVVYNKEYYKSDMLESIKIGISNLSPCDAFFMVPGDMPSIKRDTFLILKSEIQKSNGDVIFATIDGYKKHPPIVSYKLKNTILNYRGEGGLRELWKKDEINIGYLPVNDYGCCIDIDTKEDYKNLINYMEREEKDNSK